MAGGNTVGPESVMLVPSFSPETGQAIRYTLGPQATASKARSEHYLHVGEFNRTYCSEFSMMLDPNMTIAEKTRKHDGRPNWVILRQWHQSAPESPPIALMLDGGSDNGRLKVWLREERWGDGLEETDVLFDYHGPIVYTLNGKPESENNSHSNAIREQQGIYQGAHLAKMSFHAVSIANVRIDQVP
jgi:hypothetical protein